MSPSGKNSPLWAKPIRYGYMNGIALTVLASQLSKLFDLSVDGDGPLRNLAEVARSLLGGGANWTAFAVGGGTLAAILLLKPFKRIPGMLLAVAGATIAVGVFDLDQIAGVRVLGPLPQGLPSTVHGVHAADTLAGRAFSKAQPHGFSGAYLMSGP